ncbi:MAG TPA: metallophosphoesterase family protein [Nitrospirota bacterium]|nr:metallophosphoesterase family protein [Nitrospirota bacterium]
MNTMTKKALSGLVFVLAITVFSTAAFAGILKHPYMIYPGQNTQMQILWQDNASEATNVLSWGPDTTYSMGTVTVPEYGSANQHAYTIAGLTPNTKYYYQVADQTNGLYGAGSFITAPDNSVTAIRFLGMGDSRSQPFALDNLMQAMKSFYSQPGNEDYQRLVIHNGDWVSTDGESYWTSQWFDPTKIDVVAFTANTPINGCKGNHDNSGSYPNGKSTYFPKYFPFPYQNATPVFDPATVQAYNNLYWSFDYGPVHFTVVDNYSNLAAGSAQYNWVVNDLASTTKPWKIMIYHEPAYSAGSDGDNSNVRVLEPLVTQYGVDLIYCGHSHNYARTGAYTLAQANGDQIALNVPHITSGGGGAPVYQPDMTNAGSYPHVITAWPAFEFMTFDVEGKTLTMTSYQVNNVSTTAIQSAATLTLSPIETIVLNHFTNVSPQVSATSTGFLYSRATKLYAGNLTITNNGPDLTGNVHVVLDGILNLQGIGNADNQYSTTTPKLTSKIANKPATGKGSSDPGLIANVTLVNATGSNNGEPMIQVSANGLASGASITVPLQFSNPANATITFNPVVLQE